MNTPNKAPSGPLGSPQVSDYTPSDSTLFTETVRIVDHTAATPVILHAPHGGLSIPSRFRGSFTIGDAELRAEQDAMTDHFTNDIAASISGASLVINGLSRFVVDVERFPYESEEMNAVGMGVLYTHGSRKQHIRTVPAAEETELMAFFHAYSAELTRLTAAALATHGRAIIIDLHSFPQHPLPYELHADEARPQLCIGFEDFHATPELMTAVTDAFDWLQQGSNEPFQGSYVPLDYYRRDPRVQSVMLEVRRDVYMNEAAVTPSREGVAALMSSVHLLIKDGCRAKP